MTLLPESIELEVVTPERQLVHETVDEVQLPGLRGYLGILPGHAPLISELGVGVLSYRKGNMTRYLSIVHGYAEVLPDRVIVLAAIAERAEEIDVERATRARERAEKRLAGKGADVDWDRATFALQRALVRLQAAARAGTSIPAEEHHAAP
ncbi:MAG: F0F1 ATP synthase subunit epsilon [Acidobacteriia bacterium]|jgi:F-type H+-transporting ATPase subunit epsilon|nr:F0F1 ATP synthase subunit epsilon [Terriglobia bacterium]